ncbi:UNVERIFIED_CONTAM: hypothetical protein H355_006503 [Colinus virginianus]|nr:hypothetical protein H355_006503 [Colinus virginianus]
MRTAAAVGVLCLVSLVAALDYKYHHSEELEAYLKEVHAAHPTLTHLHSIGRSVEGRDLWVLVLGRFPTQHKIGIPEFKYVANMHGDETVGREILLHLIDHLVTSYGRDPAITRLLNNTRIHIMPTMNPDGFEATVVPDCYYSRGRYGRQRAPALDFCAGAYGQKVTGTSNGYSRSPDDDVFIHLAKTYSFNHASMYKGTGCDSRQTFPDGITNGYSWYQLEGGMQDYNYVWGQCFEITLELSCCKYPPAEQLEKFWRDNKVALVEYIKQVHLGVKGQVTDKNGNPIPNAIVEAKGRPHICPYRTNEHGEYFLLLLPGKYVINATVPGFKSVLKTVDIADNTANFSALKQDFSFPELSVKPGAASCPRIPLYQELERSSAAVKPTLHILVLVTVTMSIFK